MRPYVNEDTCIACGTCKSVCPTDPNVFEVNDVSKVVHPEACTDCGECEERCPLDAIEMRN